MVPVNSIRTSDRGAELASSGIPGQEPSPKERPQPTNVSHSSTLELPGATEEIAHSQEGLSEPPAPGVKVTGQASSWKEGISLFEEYIDALDYVDSEESSEEDGQAPNRTDSQEAGGDEIVICLLRSSSLFTVEVTVLNRTVTIL